MINADTHPRIEYFIQLLPFEGAQDSIENVRIRGRHYLPQVVFPEDMVMAISSNPELRAAIGAGRGYAENAYDYTKDSEARNTAPRLVNITKYTDGRLEVEVREERD